MPWVPSRKPLRTLCAFVGPFTGVFFWLIMLIYRISGLDIVERVHTGPLMAFQMLSFREPPFAVHAFLG